MILPRAFICVVRICSCSTFFFVCLFINQTLRMKTFPSSRPPLNYFPMMRRQGDICTYKIGGNTILIMSDKKTKEGDGWKLMCFQFNSNYG